MEIIIIFLLAISHLFGVGTCTLMEEMEQKKEVKASHFVFVHGAMHGAWCWYEIRTRLESAGHKVSCLDLTGAGIDLSNPNTVFKFSEYNKPLLDFMSALPDDEKVTLVGHSAGGLSVTHSIQEFGNKIHVAVYICGVMLPTDLPVLSSDEYEFGYGLGPDKPRTSVLLKKEFQRRVLYHLSPAEDSTLASMLLRPLPIMAIQDAKFGRGGDMDKVKRVFIKTLQDQSVRPEEQDRWIEMWPPSEVLNIESDHSPFFSAPTHLINLLLEAIVTHK